MRMLILFRTQRLKNSHFLSKLVLFGGEELFDRDQWFFSLWLVSYAQRSIIRNALIPLILSVSRMNDVQDGIGLRILHYKLLLSFVQSLHRS
jgi:hypothetical protein